MKNTIALSLQEIADWQLTTRDKVAPGACWARMPSFQRGLVWSPAQIEVLWDSLMRGIPIGALSLLPIEGNERFRRGEADEDFSGAYWIVDGQQRSNAIALGFSPFPRENENTPILWLDLLPDRSKRTRRKFFFYVTTPGRPWGYCVSSDNDEKKSEKVPVDEYRRILKEELRWDKGMGSKPPTNRLWPAMAKMPVPFSLLRELYDAKHSLGGVIDIVCAESVEWARHFRHSLDSHKEDPGFQLRLDEELRLIEGGLSRVRDARTIGLIASGGLSGDEEENQEADENSNLAVYFSRLNTGGTEPKREDLDYSILKSVVPELSVIDEYARGLMHPARLANIAMLTYLSREKWKNALNRSDIYRLQFDEGFRLFILPSIDTGLSRFKQAVDTVKTWLEYSSDNELGLPTVLCSSMAKESPRLYRFLILLALLLWETDSHIDQRMLIAFVTIVCWFGKDENLDYQMLYERTLDKERPDNVVSILAAWIGSQIEGGNEGGKIAMPPRVEDFEAIKTALLKKDLDLVRKVWSPIGYSDGLNGLWHWQSVAGRGFLLYACRRYLAKTFKDYDPASAVWNEDDRPWDYDHIIPQSWLQQGRGNRHGPHHEIVSKFLMSIGNVAPVPFSINRSKNDAPPADYLGDDDEMVFIDFHGFDGSRPRFIDEWPKKRLEDDKASSCHFAYMTTVRWIALYKEWLLLPVFELLSKSVNVKRKENLTAIQHFLYSTTGKAARIVFFWSDGKQYDVVEEWDWTRPWIACGVNVTFHQSTEKSVKCFLCACVQHDWFEVGLRRPPESDSLLDDHNQWWIEDQDGLFMETDSLDKALDHLKLLLTRSDVVI